MVWIISRWMAVMKDANVSKVEVGEDEDKFEPWEVEGVRDDDDAVECGLRSRCAPFRGATKDDGEEDEVEGSRNGRAQGAMHIKMTRHKDCLSVLMKCFDCLLSISTLLHV
jgi:hypothetical protein